MRVLFDGRAPIDYGQIYLTSRELPDMTGAFAGQVNGLCGAGDPGRLFLMAGTHYGHVGFRVELHDAEPPEAAPQWQDVVEVSFVPRAGVVNLVPWGDGSLAALPLLEDGQDTGPLPVFRVRYCAAGMDEGRDPYGGHDPDELEDGDYTYLDQRPDRYLLCFWPDAGPRGDAILRRTSAAAAYWHDWAARLPAPPTLWERVEAELRERRERQRRQEERQRLEEARRWGGRPPSERLRRVRGNVYGIALLDRDLVDGIAALDDAAQRRIAVWAARRACTVARIADLDWFAPAWRALERGEPLPAEFTDVPALLTRIRGKRTYTVSVSVRRLGWARTDPLRDALDGPVEPVAMALPALVAAAAADPLQAALEAVWAAVSTYAARRGEFLAEIRRAFPTVDRPAGQAGASS
ncbi:hypothetical protein Daura_29665 [Dactylosporangium aurantiacum]|uniref:Uncharacterized protein n=1 Tax=Dactylosporangium aurantiacum TaxID=35754 RepID=A0A9Q9IAY1_9ACTN|nr:hypothetical protein [Dactylosporangium aurantiacum]MDG6106821.1 hypothetical protein [Dactylosporangium aurantiacum]UWZ50958.1 hypothetical protein Daura_29665 [Dactylosporangium aurantiacum]